MAIALPKDESDARVACCIVRYQIAHRRVARVIVCNAELPMGVALLESRVQALSKPLNPWIVHWEDYRDEGAVPDLRGCRPGARVRYIRPLLQPVPVVLLDRSVIECCIVVL